MFDRRLLTHFDWVLLFLVCLIAGIGILNLYSATSSWEAELTPVYVKQFYWLCIGLSIALALSLFDYRHLEYFAMPLYVVNIMLLLLVLVAGKTSMGATRWLNLGFFNLQPSELMKIMIIFVLARHYNHRDPLLGFDLRGLLTPFALLGVPTLLIMKQPDLGTAMLVIFIAASIALFAGIQRRTLLTLGVLGIGAVYAGWRMLHGYQKERILTFINPERDPLGSGYHIIQSKIAVGSGGFLGKGFMQGTQSQLSFLPERHTDFAFSVFAEEWGFSGSLILVLLYLLLVSWGIYVARRANDRFGMYIALGVTAMLFWHIVVNLGMVIGLLPVVGVPLPLFSYGGTSMVTTMVGVGLLLNISMRRFMF